MSQKRNILIVGATGAMGSTLATALSAHPDIQLILMGRNIKKLESLADTLPVGPQIPILLPVNLLGATPNDYETLKVELEKSCGPLHGILFTAAELGSLTPIEHYPVGQWYNVMQVNAQAPFLITQSFLPLLKQADSADLVFLHDPVTNAPKAYWGAYAVAEAARHQFAELLKIEMPSHIQVHSLFLSRFKSNITQKAFPGMFLEGPEMAFPPASDCVESIIKIFSARSL